MRSAIFSTAVVMIAMTTPGLSGPAPFGVNLIVNGDAETGTMDGWSPMDLIELTPSSGPGFVGVPPDQSIGRFCFTSALGPEMEQCNQIIDLSDHALAIDSGELMCTMSGLVQSRTAGGIFDTVDITYAFLNESGVTVHAAIFVDDSIVPDVFDWFAFDEDVLIPSGTRSVDIVVYMERDGGLSTNAYADNLSFVIHGDNPADLNGDGVVGPADLAMILGNWGPCDRPENCPQDLNGDGVVGPADLAILLGSWG